MYTTMSHIRVCVCIHVSFDVLAGAEGLRSGLRTCLGLQAMLLGETFELTSHGLGFGVWDLEFGLRFWDSGDGRHGIRPDCRAEHREPPRHN